MPFPLASFFVAFTAKGTETTGAALHGIKGAFVGMAASGVIASQEMERFSYAQSELSRTVGSVFKPVLDKATDAIFSFTSKLQQSAGMEKLQDAFGRIMDVALELFDAFGEDLLLDTVDVLAVTFEAIADSLEWIRDLFHDINEATEGWAQVIMRRLISPIVYIKDMIGFISDWIETGSLEEANKRYMERLDKERTEGPERKKGNMALLSPKGGGMEDFKATYTRIQQAMFKLGETDYAKDTASHTKRTADAVEKLAGRPEPEPAVGY